MPGGFDIAMEHICSDPFLDFVDYGRLAATSRFGAYTVSHGTAVAELRRLQAAATMQCGFDLAMKRICRDPCSSTNKPLYSELCSPKMSIQSLASTLAHFLFLAALL